MRASDPALSSSNPESALRRRAVLGAAAWGVPVVAIALASPAAAASTPPQTDPNTTYYPSTDAFPAYSSHGASAPVTVSMSNYNGTTSSLGFDGNWMVTTASTTAQSYYFIVDMTKAPFNGMDGTKVRVTNAKTTYDPVTKMLMVEGGYAWNDTVSASSPKMFDFHVTASDVPEPATDPSWYAATASSTANGQWWHSAALSVQPSAAYPYPDSIPVPWSTTVDLRALFPGATGWTGQTPQWINVTAVATSTPGVYTVSGQGAYTHYLTRSAGYTLSPFVQFGQ